MCGCLVLEQHKNGAHGLELGMWKTIKDLVWLGKGERRERAVQAGLLDFTASGRIECSRNGEQHICRH